MAFDENKRVAMGDLLGKGKRLDDEGPRNKFMLQRLLKDYAKESGKELTDLYDSDMTPEEAALDNPELGMFYGQNLSKYSQDDLEEDIGMEKALRKQPTRMGVDGKEQWVGALPLSERNPLSIDEDELNAPMADIPNDEMMLKRLNARKDAQDMKSDPSSFLRRYGEEDGEDTVEEGAKRFTKLKDMFR